MFGFRLLDWLMGRISERDESGDIASRLIEIKQNSMSRIRIEGTDLDAVLFRQHL